MKTCLIGNFANGMQEINGQTVKTFELYHALKDKMKVDCIDTYFWRSNPCRVIKDIITIFKYDSYIVCLSWSGYKIILPVLLFMKAVLHHKRIFDVVIGGIRHEQLEHNCFYRYLQKFLDGIYVESLQMRNTYQRLGISRVKYMPNFKYVKCYSKKEKTSKQFNVCTLSRVCYEKGIEDAIEAVQKLNREEICEKIILTIYGPVENRYKRKFESLIDNDYIRYGGIISYHDTTKVLSKMDVLLFPTFWEGEGFPGTIIDAFASGTPIIASDWNCNGEIIENMKQGILIEPHNVDELVKAIKYFTVNRLEIDRMSKECQARYKSFTPNNVSRVLCDDLFVYGD